MNVPSPDPAGAAFLLVDAGAAGDVVDGWRRAVLALGRPVQVLSPDPADPTGSTGGSGPDDGERRLQDLFRTALRGCRVGVRVLVAGPRAQVWALRAVGAEAGLLPDELVWVELPDGTGTTRVFCVHCDLVFRAVTGLDRTVTCPACRRLLDVVEHVSAHLGAQLAAAVDPGPVG